MVRKMKPNKLYLFSLIFIIYITTINATTFKAMHPDVNLTAHKDIWGKFPAQLTAHIKLVKVYNFDICTELFNWAGLTYTQPYGIIHSCSASEWLYAHELAHYKDYLNRGYSNHDENWCDTYLLLLHQHDIEEIYNYEGYCLR